MTTLSATVEAVRQSLTEVEDRRLLDDSTLSLAISRALQRYSKDRPRVMVTELTGNDSRYYAMSGLTGWVRGFSSIRDVEFPAIDITQNPTPRFLNADQYTVYIKPPDVEYLYLPTFSPTPSEKLRVYYTAVHTHTDASDTIYANDYQAFLSLACGMGCLVLATRFAKSQAPVISADSVDYASMQQRYRDQANAWFDLYENQMDGVTVDSVGGGQGSSGGGAAPASVTANWEHLLPGLESGPRTRRYLNH